MPSHIIPQSQTASCFPTQLSQIHVHCSSGLSEIQNIHICRLLDAQVENLTRWQNDNITRWHYDKIIIIIIHMAIHVFIQRGKTYLSHHLVGNSNSKSKLAHLSRCSYVWDAPPNHNADCCFFSMLLMADARNDDGISKYLNRSPVNLSIFPQGPESV